MDPVTITLSENALAGIVIGGIVLIIFLIAFVIVPIICHYGDCIKRGAKHNLKYGGLYIVGLAAYLFFFWGIPLDIARECNMYEWSSVLTAHGIGLVFAWLIYGCFKMCGDV